MKHLILSLFLALALSVTGCKSLVTSAPEQWVAKIGDAMLLIEDTKGLIELAKELGMEWVTLVKQKDGSYAVKDHTEKLKGAPQVYDNPETVPSMATSMAPQSTPNEIRVEINDIIRRTRVVH